MNSEEEFYDAVTGFESDNSSGEFSEAIHKVGVDIQHTNSTGRHNGDGQVQQNGIKKHRMALPAPMFTRSDFSVWSILKKCIGLELSKITMPIAFNEPLSFLQRITEYMEHTYLIHKACSHSNPLERMQTVAAFAVSAVASQWERTGKPFNPLLGETYELIREDLGFRFISEQVSHHPPISAFYSEGLNQDFIFHGSIYPKLKFWGKSVEAEPRGIITLELLKNHEAYTWTNPTCCVHNVIIGKLWIEQYGTVEIVNHSTGDKCILNFKPCGLFGKELHRIEGYIQDKNKKKLSVIYGKWTECLWCVDPLTYESAKKNEKRGGGDQKKPKPNEDAENDEADDMPEVQETVQVIPGSKLLWRISSRPPNSSQMYNFTSFAVTLNELEKGMEEILAPTDCRLRPDIRHMENGEIDLASKEKERLEEKQRASRKERAKDETEWRTRWFYQDGTVYLSGLRSNLSMIRHGQRLKVVHDFPKYSIKVLPWLSPEVLQQNLQGYDAKSDIYSVGITACELANGHVPFKDMPVTQMLLEKLNGTVPCLLDTTTIPPEELTTKPLRSGASMGFGEDMAASNARASNGEAAPHPYLRTFSPYFHHFVEQCLHRNPELRPSASTLLNHSFFKQIKRRPSEALPELLYPVTPITSFEGLKVQDPSSIFGVASNLEHLNLDDWEF